MRILFTTLFISILFKLTVAQNYSGPESVEYDYAQQRYLISNTGSHQIIALKNGVKTVFATLTGSGPHGIEIVGDTLYCCNGTKITALLLSNGSVVYSKTMGSGFLNGITHDPFGNLYVTDFSAKKIYRLNSTTRNFNVFVANTTNTPNGICYDAHDGISPRLVMCNWGSNASIKKVSLQDSSISILTTTSLSNCDGICKGKGGKFYVSSWGNQSIQRFDSSFTAAPIAVVTNLFNPADIFYNLLSDTIATPNASNNTVVFHYQGTTNGLNNINNSPAFQLSYKPGESVITILTEYSDAVKVRIVNIQMQEIYFAKTIANNNKQIEVNLVNYPTGTYFVQLNEGAFQKLQLTH